jgi:hydroxypyruvate isomerase
MLKMPLKFCANLSLMFQETSSLLERYQLAKDVGFRAVECAFPYIHTVEEVAAAQKKANVEQILINAFVGENIPVTQTHHVYVVMYFRNHT